MIEIEIASVPPSAVNALRLTGPRFAFAANRSDPESSRDVSPQQRKGEDDSTIVELEPQAIRAHTFNILI